MSLKSETVIDYICAKEFVDFNCAKECCNPDNFLKYTCYKCGKCGRKFEGQIMVDSGGTTPRSVTEEY